MSDNPRHPPRRRRVIAAAILAAVFSALVISAPASASRGELTFFDAPHELSGELGAATRAQTLDQLKALGVNVVRYLVYWRQIAPGPASTTPPAGFDPRNPATYGPAGQNWNQVDTIVQGAAARGMDVSLVLSGQPPTGQVPRWASRDPNGLQSDPSPKAFEDFAYAVGKRYGGGPGSVGNVRFISLVNEPNIPLFLNAARGQPPKAVAPLYRELIEAGQAGLAASGWHRQVLIGETGPSPPGTARDPVPFLQRTLCLNRRYKPVGHCAPLTVAGWAHHPYSFGVPPFRPPLNPGQISYDNLKLLQRALNRAHRAGALRTRTPIYSTEFGYPSKPDTSFGVPRLQQAEFDAIAEYKGYNSSGVASFAQYLMRDDRPGSGANGAFASGLCPYNAPDRADSLYSGLQGIGCKPAFAAFRTPLVVRARGAKRVTIWGYVRPARGSTQVRIRVRNRSGKVKLLRILSTDSGGYFSFSSKNRPGRRWGVTWHGLKGPLVRAYRF